jgi:chaperonin GroEL
MSNLIKRKEAIEGMMRGVELATDAIRETYGGGGSNVIVETKERPKHAIYNDAWSIIKRLQVEDLILKDPAARIGLEFVKELCERQDRLSGDSRKTSILLLSEILKKGYQADINKLQLKKELDALIPFIESEIDKQTKQIDINEVDAVATTASENPEIGKLLQEIYQQIGRNGIIQYEGGSTYESSYRIMDGICFDMACMLSPYMIHNDKNKAIYEKPLILVTKKKIVKKAELNRVLKAVEVDKKKDLVIFAKDMDSFVVSELTDIHSKNGTYDNYGNFHPLNILIIKVPSLWSDYYFEDFAKCTGSTIIEDASGINFDNIKLEHLGTCDKITTDANETIVDSSIDISEHIAQLQAKGDDSKLRLTWLNRKKAILKLGNNGETDLSYKLLKLADAIRSSELALKYGVVAGGGWCLNSIADTLPETIAGSIMNKTLEAPYNQIVVNNGGLEHATDRNILDASAVIKSAIRSAIGIASTILTASSIVYLPDEPMIKEQQHAFQ